MISRHHLMTAGAIAVTAALLGAAPALAAPPAGAGGPPAAVSFGCPAESLSQPFAQFGDTNEYFLIRGGNFEGGPAGWQLSDGAAIVPGNESFDVGSPQDSYSLSLPAGASATSAAFCVSANDPYMRFFATNSGDPSSALTVAVTASVLGHRFTAPFATITSSGSWQPTPPEAFGANLLSILPGDPTADVSFTFTPKGSGDWQIDDVYVDPMGMGG